MQCSWRENTGTWFSISNVCIHVVWYVFVAQKESGWNMISKVMKYVTAITYRWALGWGGTHGAYEVTLKGVLFKKVPWDSFSCSFLGLAKRRKLCFFKLC